MPYYIVCFCYTVPGISVYLSPGCEMLTFFGYNIWVHQFLRKVDCNLAVTFSVIRLNSKFLSPWTKSMVLVLSRIKWDKKTQGNLIAVADTVVCMINSHSPLPLWIPNFDAFVWQPA